MVNGQMLREIGSGALPSGLGLPIYAKYDKYVYQHGIKQRLKQ